MSTKFSAFTPATDCANADIVVGLQGGGNFKVTRTLLLSGKTTEEISLKAGAGGVAGLRNNSAGCDVFCQANGDVDCAVSHAYHVTSSVNGQIILTVDVLGNWSMLPAVGGFITIGKAGKPYLMYDEPANTMRLESNVALVCSFFDNGAGDWAIAAPATYQLAFDRLSALVRALNAGVPIP